MLEGCVPFPPETAETYRRLGYWQGKIIGAYVQDWARQYSDRVALISEREYITYRLLAERSDRLALARLRLGIKPMDRVMVQLPNVPDFVYLVFALFRIGALPVLALPAHREYEISHLIEHAQATAYAIPAAFGTFDYQELARAVRAQRPTLQHILVSGQSSASDMTSLDDLMQSESHASAEAAAQLERLQPDPAEVAVFLLSGGTTGRPKMIPRTHDDYAYNFRTSAQVCGFGPETIYLISLPIGHNFPFTDLPRCRSRPALFLPGIGRHNEQVWQEEGFPGPFARAGVVRIGVEDTCVLGSEDTTHIRAVGERNARGDACSHHAR